MRPATSTSPSWIPTPTSWPGPTFSSNGQSLMPPGFGQSLQPTQVDALVAYLMTLK